MVTQELTAPRPNRLAISLGVFALWALLIIGGQRVLFPNAGNLDELVTTQVNYIFVTAVVLLLGVTFFLRWQRPVGLKPAAPPSSWLIVWPQALAILLILGGALTLGLPPTSVILFVLINTLLVGVHEELACRGILFLGLLSRLSIWQAILLTSFLFGAVHALNGFLTGNFGGALTQAAVAMMSGLWFQAVRLRARSIYPAMLFHGLWDFSVFIFGQSSAQAAKAAGAAAASPAALLSLLILVLPLLFMLYGLWLIRGIGKQTRDEVLA